MNQIVTDEAVMTGANYIVYWNIDTAGNEIKFGFVGNNQYSSNTIVMTTPEIRSTTFPYHTLFAGIDQTMTLNEPFEGKISEVLFYNGKINDDEIININSYLSKKWNLTSTIDSDGDGIVDASDPFPTDPSKWISFPQALRDNASDNFTAMDGLVLWLDATNIDGEMNSSLCDSCVQY